ncbi:MAG: helix-turn-helix domain-containing protein [Pseudomonadota bacterium]|nr:helix-turn-helix domain-containing protein [Pseudomonadota bacterium]
MANVQQLARTVKLSTAEQPVHRRLDWLRQVIGREYANVDITPPTDAPLFNEMTITPWRHLQLSSIRSNAISLHRLPREPQLVGQDAYFAVILLSGAYRLRQAGRETVLSPGDMTIYDAAGLHRIDCPKSFRKVIVSIPRSVLEPRMPNVGTCTARRICGRRGIGAMASKFIQACAREMPVISQTDFDALAEYSVDLIIRALASVGPQTYSLTEERSSTLRAVEAYIERRLVDVGLNSNAIAAGVGLSARYINQLFKSQNTSMMRYVWSRRLERARQALLDWDVRRRPLTDLALQCGFNDPVHFSHAFKKRFGCSPREYRHLSQDEQRDARRAGRVSTEGE